MRALLAGCAVLVVTGCSGGNEAKDAGSTTPPPPALSRTQMVQVGKPIAAIVVSTDGTRIAVGQVGALDVRDVMGTVVNTIPVMPGQVSAIAFSSDGTELVAGGQNNALKVWNIAAMMDTQTLTGTAFGIRAASVTSSGLIAASLGDNTVRTFTISGSSVRQWNQQVAVMAFENEAVLVTGGADGTIQRVNAGTGGNVSTVSNHASPIVALALGGGKVFTAAQDGHVRLGELSTGNELKTWEVPNASAVAFDGTRMVVGTSGGKLVVVRMDGTMDELLDSTNGVTAMAFAGSSLVTGRSEGTLGFYSVRE